MRTLKLAILAAPLYLTGCYAHHHHDPAPAMCALATCFGLSAVGAPPEVAVAGGLVAGAVMDEAVHHDHWHSNRCGCPYRWMNGYRVYWYGGHWEYYDDRYDTWRYVPENRGPSW